MMPSDFSPVSRTSLDFGVRFYNFLQADLHLVHLVDLPKVENLKEMYATSGWTLPESHDLNLDPVPQELLGKGNTIREPPLRR